MQNLLRKNTAPQSEAKCCFGLTPYWQEGARKYAAPENQQAYETRMSISTRNLRYALKTHTFSQ